MKRLSCVLFALAFVGAASAADEWHIETVDSEGDVGLYTSLALDSSGRLHISYHDNTNEDLKYARWNGSSWQIETVDSDGNVGSYTSLALDSSDYPHISYCCYDEESDNHYLKYARWDGTDWQIEIVDSNGSMGVHTSLALDTSDNPHISYRDMTIYDLKYARWDGSNWRIETVDTEEDVGGYNSLVLDSFEYPHISYQKWGSSPSDLKYARWDGSSWWIEIVDSSGYAGAHTSLALDTINNPHISYQDEGNLNLKYVHWDGDSWQIETVDSEGFDTSLALDSSGNPNISYYCNGDLKYAHWDGANWQIKTVDSDGYAGLYTSLALDTTDKPHISYYDKTEDDLKYAWFGDDTGVEGAELTADIRDEGVLVGWAITGDAPASLTVLRSVDDSEPVAIHDNPLPGSATCYLDRKDKGFQPLVQPLAAGMEYRYWLEVTEADGTVKRFGPTESVSIPEQISRLALGEPYPSPAREAVTLTYELPNGCSVAVIEVYDLSGRRLDSIPLTDSGEITLEVSEYASGVYTARLSTDKGSVSRRLVITR